MPKRQLVARCLLGAALGAAWLAPLASHALDAVAPVSQEVFFEPGPVPGTFVGRFAPYRVATRLEGFLVSSGSDELAVEFIGGGAKVGVGVDRRSSTTSYFSRSSQRSGVANFARVRYPDVYAGIAVEYYPRDGRLEYDFIVEPNADPKAIRVAFPKEATLTARADGALVIEHAGQQFVQPAPEAYQTVAGARRSIDVRHAVDANNVVTFEIGVYDSDEVLVIDPLVLRYGTYLGANGIYDTVSAVRLDNAGNLYVIGRVSGTGFPRAGGGYGNECDHVCTWVAKFDAQSRLIFTAYIAGAQGEGVSYDASGSVYVVGTIWLSYAFPFTPGVLSTRENGPFVLKLSSDGQRLVFSTAVNGQGGGPGHDIAVDGAGRSYITGAVYAINFPTTPGAFQSTSRSTNATDAFVSIVNQDGTALVASTLLSGTLDDEGRGIAIDAGGYVYVAGLTESTDFPGSPGAYRGGDSDSFVAKFDPGLTRLEFIRLHGGSGGELAVGVDHDRSGGAIIFGNTTSADMPTTPGAFRRTKPGETSLFAARVNGAGNYVYSSFLGSDYVDVAAAIAADDAGNAYVVGATWSREFPTTADGLLSFPPGVEVFSAGRDGYLSVLSAAGDRLLYSTYISGLYVPSVNSKLEATFAVAANARGEVAIGGSTHANDMPITPDAVQATTNGINSAYVLRFAPQDFYVPTDTLLMPTVRGKAYAQQLTAIGGTPPFRWDVVSGNVPGGIAVLADGRILGTAPLIDPRSQVDPLPYSLPNGHLFTVRVRDAEDRVAHRGHVLFVFQPLDVSGGWTFGGAPGSPLRLDLYPSTGLGPFRWQMVSGCLPPGVSLSGGVISGTPTEEGQYAAQIVITDAYGDISMGTVSGRIAEPANPPGGAAYTNRCVTAPPAGGGGATQPGNAGAPASAGGGGSGSDLVLLLLLVPLLSTWHSDHRKQRRT